MKFDQLIASDTLIPSLPVTVAQIFGEFQKPEPNIRQITTLVSAEVGLTVRVLRLLNSARYGSGGRIGTMEAAIPLLGLKATKQLVSAAAVGGAFRVVPGVNLPEFWRHSLDVAKIAQSLAGSMRLDKGLAFTAGLLHGVGDLVMKMAMPDEPCMQPNFAQDSNRHASQLAALGYSYADVGAAFAAKWRFPQEIVDAIQHHPNPQDDVAADTLAGILYLASWGGRAHELDLDTPSMLEQYPHRVADAIGCTEEERLCSEDAIEWTRPEEAGDFS
ncbi:HDOD domain-containing protein [Rhodoferax sp.]|uniref:HDOD domain-containing protein n=1 Tax=Rhodoferax sp. TaxID=50421 RepID=UPI0025DC29AF|nr:HDOD domain-containing protein [Rhodoferax sp.]